jgi:hypothetical protein
MHRTRCYLVLDDAGKSVGKLKKLRNEWILYIYGKTFIPLHGSIAWGAGVKNNPCKGFTSVAKARKFLKNPTFAPPKK